MYIFTESLTYLCSFHICPNRIILERFGNHIKGLRRRSLQTVPFPPSPPSSFPFLPSPSPPPLSPLPRPVRGREGFPPPETPPLVGFYHICCFPMGEPGCTLGSPGVHSPALRCTKSPPQSVHFWVFSQSRECYLCSP